MELTLTTDEQELLLGILEQRPSGAAEKDFSHGPSDFKLGLRRNEKLLESILSRLRGAPIQEVRG